MDGRLVYAATPGTDGVSVIDTTLDPPQVTRKLRLLGEVKDLAVTPDGKWLIVGTIFSNTVTVYDIATQAVSSIRVGREPYHLAVNAAGTRAYTSDYDTSTVSVVDLTRDPPRTIETIFGFAKPRGMCFSEDGRRLYVANSGPDSSGKYSISVVAV
jgi:YVTN family beta-propeller protein